MRVAIYNGITGAIVRAIDTSEASIAQITLAENEAMLPTVDVLADPDLHYVWRGRLLVRPALPEHVVYGNFLSFEDALPEGTEISIESDYVNTLIAAGAHLTFALAVPEAAEVSITPPWPYQMGALSLTAEGAIDPGEADLTIEPDLERMRSYTLASLYVRAEQYTLAVLGGPDLPTLRRWALKRSLLDRHEAGTLTAAETVALEQEARYTDQSIEDLLADIRRKVDIENYVTLRADGLREAIETRVIAATTYQEMIAAIQWGEAENLVAITEAENMK